MSLRHVFNVVGLLTIFIGLSMLAPAGIALIYRDGDLPAFLAAAGITVATGLLTWRTTSIDGELSPREGFAVVTLAWVAAGVFGALPFVFSGVVPTFLPALFEALSGMTTTGATVFTDIEALPHGILFWRSMTHWLGGMGIIVLAVAVLPYLGVGGMQLFKAEVPGPTHERLRPRIAQTAKSLWLVYAGLTLLQTLLYAVGGMSLFDAINHAFSTLATGGFSTKNASMAYFTSPFIQYVTIVFMYLAGINFALHFRAATGRFGYLRDVEWRFFTAVAVGFGVLVGLVNLTGGDYAFSLAGVELAIRDGLFQAISLATTTGFVSADFEEWMPAAQALLFCLLFVGGMAGSTGGGIKAVRVLLLLKQTGMELRKQLHPRAVILARVGKHVVREDVLANVIGFVILYLLLCLAGTLLLALLGVDLVTAIGASLATVGNIGPGLGEVGAVDNYGWMTSTQLGVLSFLMVVGRLEIYTVLLLFMPETWARRRGNGRSRVVRSTN